MTSKALALVDPDVMPPNPYGFTRKSQLRAYQREHLRSLPPHLRPGHGGGGEDLEAAALADEAAADAREWAEFLAGRS